MPTIKLTVGVDLLDGVYVGSGSEGRASWPPAPSRVYQALISALYARGNPGAGRAAVKALESAPAPVIRASRSASTSRGVYLYPRTRVSSDKKTPTNPHARGSAIRYGHAVQRPDSSRVEYLIDVPKVEGVSGGEMVQALDDVARQVPYLGTSETPASLTVIAGHGSADPGHLTWQPGQPRDTGMRMWAPGLLDALDDRHRALTAGHRVRWPDHLQPRITYTALNPDTEVPVHAAITFETPLRMSAAVRLLNDVNGAVEGLESRVHLLPMATPAYRSGRTYGFLVEGRDLHEALPRVYDVLDERGVEGDSLEPLPMLCRPGALLDTATSWYSVTAVDAPGTADTAAEYVRGYISQRHGLSPDAVAVEVTALPQDALHPRAGHHPGCSYWQVAIVTDTPITGPVYAGTSPHGPAGLLAALPLPKERI